MEVDIDKLALLARIKLSSEEKAKFQKEFGAILGYVSKLKKIDVSGISDVEASQTTDIKNIMREDGEKIVAESFSEELMKEVPSIENGFVKVSHILE